MEGSVTISRKGCDRLAGGHLWIYRGDVEKAGRGLAAGDVVTVKDGRGRFLAKAFWSERSQIALRVVTRDEEPVDDAFLAERIDRAVSLREHMLPGVSALRVFHGEADLLPGLVADRYGDVVVIQTLVPATDRRKETLAALLAERLGAKTVVERNDVRVRGLEGLEQAKGVLRGPAPGASEYREGEVRLALDVIGGQKTGAFLDQRENHLRAGEYARGRCLDCFSYTGGFALQLARAAEHVTAVEMQAPAAALLRANAALNGATNVDVVEQNAFDYLRDEAEKEPAWDLVVLDPPAFAKNKDRVRRGAAWLQGDQPPRDADPEAGRDPRDVVVQLPHAGGGAGGARPRRRQRRGAEGAAPGAARRRARSPGAPGRPGDPLLEVLLPQDPLARTT